jgi:hypothetical protein
VLPIRDGIYFVIDNRVNAPRYERLGRVCRVMFHDEVNVVSMPQEEDTFDVNVASFPWDVPAPAFESFDDRFAVRTAEGEVLLIWPTLTNFNELVDEALASFDTSEYPPLEPAANTDEGRQAFLKQFVP